MRKLPLAALFFAACNLTHQSAVSDLSGAARAGDAASIQQLVRGGADPNAPSGGNGWTPLLHAVHKHQNDSIAALITAGADVNRAAADGTTPLMMAAGYGYDDTVQLLLQRGANAAVKSPAGETALDWALDGTTDIDRLTFFSCQDSTARLLHRAAPAVTATAGSQRWAKMKRCAV